MKLFLPTALLFLMQAPSLFLVLVLIRRACKYGEIGISKAISSRRVFSKRV